MFKCDKCGSCCMQVGKSSIYAELDRGDGVCRFFDCKTRLCTIYENRPLLCNVDRAYEKIFGRRVSREKYYELNYEACKIIRNGGRRPL